MATCRPHQPPPLAALLMALAWACGGEPSGTVAGPDGSPCVPIVHQEGCYEPEAQPSERMRCDAKTRRWTRIATCNIDTPCVETPDLTAPIRGALVTACGEAGSAPTGRDEDAGSTSDAERTGAPRIEVLIDGQEKTIHTFPYVDPAKKQALAAVIKIRNTSASPVALTTLQWQTVNPKLSVTWLSGTPKLPLTFKGKATITLQVTYKAWVSPNSAAPGFLSIAHPGATGPTSLTFNVPVAAPKPMACAHTPSLVFVDPPPNASTAGCVRLGSCGSAPLHFEEAKITQGAPYKVSQSPAKGATLPPAGDPANLPLTPATLEICVTVTPNPSLPASNYAGKLLARTDGGDVEYQLAVKSTETPKMKVECGGNGFVLDYEHTNGDRFCTVTNEGNDMIVLMSASVDPINPSDKTGVSQLYLRKAYIVKSATQGGGSSPVTKWPQNLEPGQHLKVGATFTGGKTTGVPDAKLTVYWQHHSAEGRQRFDLRSGECLTRRLAWAPTGVPLPLFAKGAVPGTMKLVLANLGCGDLSVLKGCVMSSTTSTPSTLCAPSNLSKLAAVNASGGIGKYTLKAGTFQALALKTEATGSATSAQQATLAMGWCPVKGTLSSCPKTLQIAYQTLQVSAGKKIDLPQPGTGIETVSVGRPTRISVSPRQGPWPLVKAKSYVWWVGYRPQGSRAWIEAEDQVTGDPSVPFTADVAGSYGLRVMARFQDPTDPKRSLWSPPVAIDFTASP